MAFTSLLIGASAAVAGLLGGIHMLYTFSGNKLHPRDTALCAAMKASSPVITRETTVWRATKGFNASHSQGVLLFAAVYIYLAAWHADFLLQSTFLLALGMAVLLVYVGLAKAYWFSIPLRGIGLASALYAAGLVALVWN